ncbi:MarR family winged helix-turn-helix transcriptional regulator [Vibrio renipiscarius]|uniref:MarR family transcriptional regulator n=1 Tax=Vibrio renipiscarius TaxID=1461322 RepID=A0A0C2NEZ0_9VIBR|nr:MarR family transcriptional regulator [Vibrio renipiscarius]KII76331.1 MarR family transcriptional regulator [Vibrio renipiscarius]KII78146.1 MarR family transcriptional regulator [Vibrio renipiscarius]
MSDKKSLDSLFKLVHSLKRNAQAQIETLALDIAPMHVRVLKIISKKPRCTAVDIAHFLERDKAQVTRLLNSLIEKNLIIKAPNPEDKRSQCLLITESGQAIMSTIAQVDEVMFDKIKEGLSDEELDVFDYVAKKMAKNLSMTSTK